MRILMLTIVIVMRMGTRVSGECRLVGMRELMVVVEEKGVCRAVGALGQVHFESAKSCLQCDATIVAQLVSLLVVLLLAAKVASSPL